MRTLASCEVIGTISADQLAAARSAIRESAAPAPKSMLGKALSVIASVCRRPADMDEVAAALWSERLKAVLSGYPADVALGALEEWPRTHGGAFWPSEHEIRELAGLRLQARQRMIDAVNAREPKPTPKPGGLIGPEPIGRTQMFVDMVRERHGRDWAWSWLNRRNCLFDLDTVYTTSAGFDRITDACRELIEKAGIRVLHQAQFADGPADAVMLPHARAAFPRRSQPVSVAQAEAKVDDAFQRATSV